MKNLDNLNYLRDTSPEVTARFGSVGDSTCGLFSFRGPDRTQLLRVIAAAADGWDHVSVSLAHRCPTWDEMEYVKRLFFKDDEVAMQLHVPPSEHINIHSNVLHLWRPWATPIPMPPREMV